MRLRVNDKVYTHNMTGQGCISDITDAFVHVRFNNTDGKGFTLVSYTKSDADLYLSFKPYNLVDGGFAYDRPYPDVEPGQIVFVKGSLCLWEMRYFSHFDEHNRMHTFNNQKQSGPTTWWSEYSLTNPLEKHD